jgi:hypothetical protein
LEREDQKSRRGLQEGGWRCVGDGEEARAAREERSVKYKDSACDSWKGAVAEGQRIRRIYGRVLQDLTFETTEEDDPRQATTVTNPQIFPLHAGRALRHASAATPSIYIYIQVCLDWI